MTRMISFCSCCRYHWLVMVPSIKISSINPYLLTEHHMVHFAGWSDVSVILYEFSGAQNLIFWLFMSPVRWIWAASLNHRQSKVVRYCCTNSMKSWWYVSIPCWLQWESIPLGLCQDIMSNTDAWWCMLMLFWYQVNENIMSQIFLDSEAVLHIHK